jgi:PAS domain S-box-containing protein
MGLKMTKSKEAYLTEFCDDLRSLVVKQASRMINNNLYMKALLSALPVAMIAADKDGIIITVNKAAKDILGLERTKLEGSGITELFESDTEIAKKIDQALSAGKQFHIASKSLKLVPGKDVVGNMYIQPLWDEERKICGLLLTFEDQTYVTFLQDAFKRYVPPSVSEIIARNPQNLKLGGEEKTLTVLFSDLVGFTTISEKMPPKEVVILLSQYFDEMTEIIFKNQGTLKEYVADELMAIFGAPVYQPDHAKKACESAIAMSKRLGELRQIWKKQTRPLLKARIGINTGAMLVGNLGSTYRFSYGVIGDQVNLASRLEGLSSIYGTEILIGESTAKEIKNDFHLRKIDLVRVKGRNQAAYIYELIDNAISPLTEKMNNFINNYNKGFSLYKNQKWSSALEYFSIANGYKPNDGPTSIMTKRCHHYVENPPPGDWDGVFDHTTK